MFSDLPVVSRRLPTAKFDGAHRELRKPCARAGQSAEPAVSIRLRVRCWLSLEAEPSARVDRERYDRVFQGSD